MNITSPIFDEDEIENVRQCLNSKWVTQGPLTAEFESQIAGRHEVSHALATTSCTAALHLSTLALGLGPGDEVIVPAFTWITSANCIEYVGAKAVFVEVDEATFNIDPLRIEEAVNDNTKAIVAVHLFGLSAEMDEINRIAKKYDLKVIEDAACAIGTSYKGKPVGGLGDLGCFSFHPRKVITTGEGGMVTTNNKEYADLVNSYRNHGTTGLSKEYIDNPQPYAMTTFDNLGFNLRLSDIQAAVGVAQFKKLEGILSERRRLALNYSEILSGVEEIISPQDDPGHTYQSYVTRVASGDREIRNRIMENLAEKGIQTRPGTHAVHRLGYYKNKYGLKTEDFPVSAKCEDTTITMPIFPGMTDQDQSLVVDIIKKSLV